MQLHLRLQDSIIAVLGFELLFPICVLTLLAAVGWTLRPQTKKRGKLPPIKFRIVPSQNANSSTIDGAATNVTHDNGNDKTNVMKKEKSKAKKDKRKKQPLSTAASRSSRTPSTHISKPRYASVASTGKMRATNKENKAVKKIIELIRASEEQSMVKPVKVAKELSQRRCSSNSIRRVTGAASLAYTTNWLSTSTANKKGPTSSESVKPALASSKQESLKLMAEQPILPMALDEQPKTHRYPQPEEGGSTSYSRNAIAMIDVVFNLYCPQVPCRPGGVGSPVHVATTVNGNWERIRSIPLHLLDERTREWTRTLPLPTAITTFSYKYIVWDHSRGVWHHGVKRTATLSARSDRMELRGIFRFLKAPLVHMMVPLMTDKYKQDRDRSSLQGPLLDTCPCGRNNAELVKASWKSLKPGVELPVSARRGSSCGRIGPWSSSLFLPSYDGNRLVHCTDTVEDVNLDDAEYLVSKLIM